MPLSMMAVRQQHLELPVDEVDHHLLELPLAHLPVGDADGHLRHQLPQELLHRADRLHPVVHEEHLPAALDLAQDGLADRSARRT